MPMVLYIFGRWKKHVHVYVQEDYFQSTIGSKGVCDPLMVVRLHVYLNNDCINNHRKIQCCKKNYQHFKVFSVFMIKMILKHPKRGLIKPKLYISKNCKILRLYTNAEIRFLFENCEKKIINRLQSFPFFIKVVLKHPKRGLIKPKLYISKNCKILKSYTNEEIKFLFVNCEKKSSTGYSLFRFL